jgi:hypothetical protein
MSGKGYWDGADVDAESAGMAEGWGPGGTLGHGAVDAAEVLAEIESGEFDDGEGGVRSRPGYGNVLGAQKAIAARRERAARRASMLVVERMLDELPDLRDKVIDTFIPNLRDALVEKILPFSEKWDSFHKDEAKRVALSVAIAKRLKDETVTLLATVYRHAYETELRRTEALSRLGGLDPELWAEERAQAAVATPEKVAVDLKGRVRAAVEHVRRIIHDMTAPAVESPSVSEDPPEGP